MFAVVFTNKLRSLNFQVYS